MTEAELEEALRGYNAEGEYRATRKTAEKFRDSLNALNRDCRFQNPATTYQYIIALSRLGQFDEALSLRWSDMADWAGFTSELKGDWYRDGHARFFLAKGDFQAARGAVTAAMKLHDPGTPKYLLDMLVMALVHVVQNMPQAACKDVKAVIVEIDKAKMAELEDQQPLHSFDSVERLANWWLLLLKCALGEAEGVRDLSVWVAAHDMSKRRQTQALALPGSRNPMKAAMRAINKEIRGR